MDNVEARRTMPDGVCHAIETSSNRDGGYLTEGVYLKEIQERYYGLHDSILLTSRTPTSARLSNDPKFQHCKGKICYTELPVLNPDSQMIGGY
jgi:hypothetical protein